MKELTVVCAVIALGLAAATLTRPGIEATKYANPAKSRTFELTYGATVKGLSPGQTARVWLPIPRETRYQTVDVVERDVPGDATETRESTYGNQILYFDATADENGLIDFTTRYRITRREIRALRGDRSVTPPTEEDRRLFLSANNKVPLEGKHLTLLDGLKLGDVELDVARSLYDRVEEHVTYDKSQPGYGNGDVLWVCDSRTGNCTDFHSLFIALARSKGLPARFEIGFPLPPERGTGSIGGYHCWGLFYSRDHGWVPVDISEADKHPELRDYYFGSLTENRVTFTVGRDITLEPRQAAPPLNYFVYPHIEVNDSPVEREQIELQFTYRDISGAEDPQ